MIKQNELDKVAIITSLTGGLGHYSAHLAVPLSKYWTPKFITYPQIDLSGTVVRQITDSFIRKYIKYPRFDIDDNNMQTIVSICDYLHSRDIHLVNIHIATTVKRKIGYFITMALYGKQIYGQKFVFTLHDVLPFDEDKRMMKLLRIFYKLGDWYTVGNESEKAKLMKHFDISESKITVIPHGIYNLFDRDLYTKQFARSYLGLPKDKKVILFFGWLRGYKGFEYLIKAAKILKKKDDNFIVYVASGLKYASKDLVEECLMLVKKNDLQDNFMLNLNYLDTLDIEAVFKATDLVALPYTHASQSGVMMMALGFKKPVIITEAFHDKTWVDNMAGLVSKTENPVDLADKLYTLLSDDTRLEKYGKAGFNYAEKHFEWDHIAKLYSNVYKHVTSL